MAEVNNLQDWVTSEMVRGRYIFTTMSSSLPNISCEESFPLRSTLTG